MSIKSRWIGTEGAAFERVGLAFEQFGYTRPRADDGTNGAYAANIASRYASDMSEQADLAVIKYALGESAVTLRQKPIFTFREIVNRYAE